MVNNRSGCSNLHVSMAADVFITNNRYLLVALGVMLSLLAAVTFLLNTVIIVAVCKTYAQHGRAGGVGLKSGGVVKLLMTSMALVDALVAAINMPVRICQVIHNGRWVLPLDECEWRAIVSVYTCSVSILHVMSLAVDRYLAICRPLLYRQLTIKTGIIMALVSWAVPLLIFPLPVFSGWIRLVKARADCVVLNKACEVEKFGFFTGIGAFVSFYIPFCVIAILYLKVLISINNFHLRRKYGMSKKRKGKHIAQTISLIYTHFLNKNDESNQNVSGNAQDMNASCSCQPIALVKPQSVLDFAVQENGIETETLRKSGTKLKNKKALLIIGLLFITFASCWLPFAILTEIEASNIDTEFPLWVKIMTIWLGYLNSTLNPLLFYFHQGIRSSVKKLLSS